jgi:hypothetical protein
VRSFGMSKRGVSGAPVYEVAGENGLRGVSVPEREGERASASVCSWLVKDLQLQGCP